MILRARGAERLKMLQQSGYNGRATLRSAGNFCRRTACFFPFVRRAGSLWPSAETGGPDDLFEICLAAASATALGAIVTVALAFAFFADEFA